MITWYNVIIPKEKDYEPKNFSFSIRNDIVSNFPYKSYNGYSSKSFTFRNHLKFYEAKVSKLAEQYETLKEYENSLKTIK